MRRLVFMMIFSSFLVGCMSLQTPHLEKLWQGRFSLSVRSATIDNHQSGHFLLSHTPAVLTVLDLKSALGNTLARIEQGQDYAQLQAVGIDTIKAQDAQTLMKTALGFSVPINGLEYWLDGQASPWSKAETVPDKAPYETIIQNGWTITYLAYVNGLPSRLRLTRAETSDNPAISMTIVINSRTP